MSVSAIQWSPDRADSDRLPPRLARLLSSDLARWTHGGAFAALLHGTALYLLFHEVQVATAPEPPPPAAIMIELAPMAVAPPSPVEDVAPGPQMVAAPQPLPDAPDKPDEPPPPTPETVAQAIEKLPELPPLPTVPDAPAELPKPVEKPVEKKQPVPKTERKPQPDHQASRRPPAAATSAAPHSEALPAQTLAAPSPGVSTAPSTQRATWQSMLLAQLNRTKRYPDEAQMRHEQGIARVHFSIDRSGRVLSAILVNSSGSPELDQEAVATLHRASPLPAPPSDIPGATISLTVPINFSMK